MRTVSILFSVTNTVQPVRLAFFSSDLESRGTCNLANENAQIC